VRAAHRLGWEPGRGEPDEALAQAVSRRTRPVPESRERGESEAQLWPHRARIEAWLRPDEGERRGLRLSKVHTLLEPWAYLQHVFAELPKARTFDDIDALLPDRVQLRKDAVR